VYLKEIRVKIFEGKRWVRKKFGA